MLEKGLTTYFEKYLKTDSLIFKNKDALQSKYSPQTIPHREEEIEKVANILAPSLKCEKPSTLLIYGKTGTGKTLTITHVTDELKRMAEIKKLPLKIIYLNCKMKKVSDTEYRLIAELANSLGEKVPETGLPTKQVYDIFLKAVEKEKILLILILDEIDQLVNKIGGDIIYNLTRINQSLTKSEISFIGITNDLKFKEFLDSRNLSSLNDEGILFPPYNAPQLCEILEKRAKIAFKDGAYEEELLNKCAAYAAKEHGDARRALDLLRLAGELAERKGGNLVTTAILDEAFDKLGTDYILEAVSKQPTHSKIVVYSILSMLENKESTETGEVFERYVKFCSNIQKPLTQRRVSDLITELDTLGIIEAMTVSHGRYGKTRKIRSLIPPSTTPKIMKLLKEDLDL